MGRRDREGRGGRDEQGERRDRDHERGGLGDRANDPQEMRDAFRQEVKQRLKRLEERMDRLEGQR